MRIYKAEIVEALENFYGDLLFQMTTYPSIAAHLKAMALRMWEGCQAGLPVIYSEISNYHPHYLGKSKETLAQANLSLEDCYLTIAKEHGFPTWKALESLTDPYHQEFEIAVNNLLAGALEKLQQQIEQHPNLVTDRSQYGHRASLLHYAASNGVEFWRQKLPYNLPTIVRYLIEKGADTNATMQVYGGEFNTLELMLSSAHPAEAGIALELKAILS